MQRMKPIVFLGDSLSKLRAFPDGARQDAGRELARVQEGRDPIDCKSMPTVGKGVQEIRVSDKPSVILTLPQSVSGRFEGECYES